MAVQTGTVARHEKDCESKGEKWPKAVCFHQCGRGQLQVTERYSRKSSRVRARQPERNPSYSTALYLVQMRGIPISKKSNMTLRLTGCKSGYSGRKTLPKCHQAIRHKIRLRENVTYSAGSENGCGC